MILARFNQGFEWFKSQYLILLDTALANRLKTLAIAGVLFAGSLLVIPFMGSSFVPNSDFGEFSVWLDMDAGLTLDSAVGLASAAEQIIRQHPEVLSTYVSTSAENARIFVQLTGKSQRDASLEEIAAQMRQQLGTQPGFSAGMLFNTAIAETYAWEYRIQGDDMELMAQYVEKAQAILASPGWWTLPAATGKATGDQIGGGPRASWGFRHQHRLYRRYSLHPVDRQGGITV